MQKQDLFSVPETPYKGLVADRHPLALKPGEFLDAQNLRCDLGQAIRVRNGIAQALDTTGLPANAVFQGASPLIKIKEGRWMLYIALEDPGDDKVHVYNRHFDSVTGWAEEWSELTEETGAFGDTRLSPGRVSFTPIDSDEDVRAHVSYLGSTDSQGPAVVAQNGIDRPLHIVGYPLSSVTGLRAAPIVPIDAPTQARSAVAEAAAFDALDVRSGAVTPGATANGTFTATDGGHVQQVGSADDCAWEWKAGTTVTPGDYGEIVMDSDSMSLYDGVRSVPQIGLVVEAEDGSWWDGVKLYANVSYDGGAYDWELIHDPAASLNNRVHVPTNVEEIVVSAYAFARREGYFSIAMNGLRIVVANDRLTPSSTFKVRWVYAGGWVPGTAQYVVSRKAALNEAESGGVLIASGAFGLASTALRGGWQSYNAPTSFEGSNARFLHPAARGGSLPADFVFPVDPRLFYAYKVPTVNPYVDELEDTFAETWCVYRKDPGESDFMLVMNVELAAWDGNEWLISDFGEGDLFTVDDTIAPEEKDPRRRAPGAFNEVTPIGSCAVYANKRQYVGAPMIDASGQNTVGNVVKISEEGYPGRFRSLVRFDGIDDADPASGYEARLGVEDVRALVVVDGRTDSSSVLCLTDRSLFSIERAGGTSRLFNVRRIAPFGTQSPSTAVDAKGAMLWIDQSRAVRSSASGLPDLSRTFVQSRIDEINDISQVQAALHKGRVYFAHEDRVLVFNLEGAFWESRDLVPSALSVAQFLPTNIEGDSRLLYFAPDCTLYEYEADDTTDEGEAVPFALESREFHNKMFLPVAANHVALVGTAVPSVMETQRIVSEPAATVVGEIDLDTGGSLAWKYDALPGGGTPGAEGQSIRFRIECDFDTEFALVALAAETADVPLGGAIA
jgi:hypothetical protein